ncbi:Hypothetical Protein FCC1311_088112 [Hondaea fermentalgiana]|uniref:Uncharacterized protein n=1 Tax=Hondaea fermentalgiana TaxID=2315210 RepID=A0A2R5GNW2_9STRA|nr:Hypothetical Protein FCC1311_088112 [Hondaea fermentalgiana]|eukprot:GBG32586.1 Hypothetical Protein FCC1311_088112 [Hondaea fermentalgiana]
MRTPWAAYAALAVAAAAVSGCSGQDAEASPAPAPTLPPTPPTPAPTKKDRSFLISADESFLDFFVDRFDSDFDADDQDANLVVPPTFVYENGKMNNEWKKGVVVPKHLDYMVLNLWHGDHLNVTSYFEEDIKAKAEVAHKDIVSQVKVSLVQKTTTQIDFEFECAKEGTTEIEISIQREKDGKHRFKILKECIVSDGAGLLVSLHSGELAFHDGQVQPEFDVHDRRGTSFVASKEDQSDVFYFHTYLEQGGFEIVGNPIVRAHTPTEGLLKWVASTRPGLKSMAEAFKDQLAVGLVQEEAEADEDEDEDDYEEEYDEDVEASEADFEGSSPAPEGGDTKAADEITNGELEEVTDTFEAIDAEDDTFGDVCRPTISGTLSEGKKTRIVFHKEFGEKKLLGFASAGLLGMHGGRKLQVDYNCLKDGLSVISLTFYVRRLGNGNKKGSRIDFNWLKVCSAEQFSSHSEIDLMGFNVHLGMYAREEPAFFPVLNGITTEPFRWNTVSVIASPEETSTSFYVNLRESIEDDRKANNIRDVVRVRSVHVSAENGRRVSNAKLSGHGAAGGIVSSDSMPISVHYNCRKTGTVRMTLKLKVDIAKEDDDGNISELDAHSRVRTIRFHWIKYCAVTPLSQLEASTEDPLRFMLPSSMTATSGYSASAADAAAHPFRAVRAMKDGTTQPLFRASDANSKNVMSSLFHVPATDSTFALKVYKSSKGDDSDSRMHMGFLFNEPIITTSSTHCQVSLRDIGEMESIYNIGGAAFAEANGAEAAELATLPQKRSKEKMLSLYSVTRDDPIFLVVDHVCLNAGDSVVTLQLPVYGRTDKIVTFRWVKQCSYSDVKLNAKETGGAVAFFVTLAIIGTSAVFCVFLRRQRKKIRYLQSKDKEGFDRMDVISSL